jgi:hypothetical protein
MLLVGRDGQTFRLRERAQLFALARVADRAWQLLDPAGEPGPAPDAGGGVVQSHR